MSTLSSCRDDLILVTVLPDSEKTRSGSTLQGGIALKFSTFAFNIEKEYSLHLLLFLIRNLFWNSFPLRWLWRASLAWTALN
jgi:hypothetical protein